MKNFLQVLEAVKRRSPCTVCVAAAEDEELLRAVKKAAEIGFIRPVLVGSAEKMPALAAKLGLGSVPMHFAQDEAQSAEMAVALVKSGEAQVLMKGLLNTSVYMRAILNREKGLRTDRLLSLLAVYEFSGYHKLIFGSDSGINVAPGLAQKKDILCNALTAMHSMGIAVPKVALLAANELVDEKIPATADARALAEMAARGELGECIAEGPLALDVVFSREAAHHKGIKSRIAGDVDLLVFPNIETGNALGKSWLHFNSAKWAGIVLGASAPIILGSRSDTCEIKINSIALGCLAVRPE